MKYFQEFLNFKNYLDNLRMKVCRPLHSKVPGKPINALVLSSPGNSHGLCFPFYYYRNDLYRKFNILFLEHTSADLEQKGRMIDQFDGDIVFISMPLRVNGKILSNQKACKFFQTLDRKKKDLKLFSLIILTTPTHTTGACSLMLTCSLTLLRSGIL